jgi:hypothetical protein
LRRQFTAVSCLKGEAVRKRPRIGQRQAGCQPGSTVIQKSNNRRTGLFQLKIELSTARLSDIYAQQRKKKDIPAFKDLCHILTKIVK